MYYLVITDKDGNKKLIPIVESAIQQNSTEQQVTQQNTEESETQPSGQSATQTLGQVSTSTMPRKTGSLSIIFRKVNLLSTVVVNFKKISI